MWPVSFIQWTKVNRTVLPTKLKPYEGWPYLLRSPGRINIIGEHVDYTGGLVLPAAIDRSIFFAARPIEAPEWRLTALDIDRTYTLPLPIEGKTGTLWVDYLAGIGVQFQDKGLFLPPLEIAFGGDLPQGSGMSSSAALEGGMAFLLNEMLKVGASRSELAQLCKRSSNTFLGIPSGIMDQYASLNGQPSGPIVLNCATATSEPVKNAIEDYDLWLVNSMVSHDLSDGAYAKRVDECERALQVVRERFSDVTHLSQVTEEQLDVVSDSLDPIALKRATYVFAENRRVRQAISALESGSASELGQLLSLTHAGLRDDYEVSCDELDYLQREATSIGGVAGARLMGGGFGGCTINLVRSDASDAFKREIVSRYSQQYGVEAECYPVRIAAGTEMLTPA